MRGAGHADRGQIMKRGACEHPKVYDLMTVLKKRRPEVLGYLELLWQFTAKFTPQGNIGRFTNDRIEAACDWSGRRGALVDGLVRAGWLQLDQTHRILVHDWYEHADNTVRKRLTRERLCFLLPTERMSGHGPDTVQTPASLKGETLSALCTGACTGTGTCGCARPGPGASFDGDCQLEEGAAAALPSAAQPLPEISAEDKALLDAATIRRIARRRRMPQ